MRHCSFVVNFKRINCNGAYLKVSGKLFQDRQVNGFKREKFNDWERKSLREKYSLKGIWTAVGLLLAVGLIVSFIFPFLPPRHGGSWSPPTTGPEYNSRVVTSLIVFPTLIILFVITIALRSTIDLKLGYKKLGDFEVTKILELGHLKILILDNWRLFSIRKREGYFDKVKKGQRIQIKRTGTYRLIDYYVYDRKASA
jgi:hypothetical protein